jgi:hypothetical protein
MASADEYAAWLVGNANRRGTPEFDTVARAYEQAKSEERSAQQMAAQPAPAAPSIGQRIVGAGEAALSLATGATGGTVGYLAGTGAGLAREILSGRVSTPDTQRLVDEAAARGTSISMAERARANQPAAMESMRRVFQAGQQGARALTYAPRTQAGQEMAQSVGQTLTEIVPPTLPVIGAPGAVLSGVRQAAPVARQAAIVAAPVAQAVVQAPVRATQAVGRAVGLVAPEPQVLDAASATAAALNRRGGVGAEGVTPDIERRMRAEGLPIPMEGPAALTAGQASRNFSQLQFEKESAKLPVGAPLRERASNQTAVMIANFDALVDRMEPATVDPRDIGRAVNQALVNRVEVQRRQIRDAYDRARQEGEMQAPVTMAPLAQRMDELVSLEGLVPTIGAVKREAVRLGALSPDEGGQLVPQQISIDRAETLRQFVNQNTDWTDRREALVGRQINASIDAATESVGGDLYRSARKLRERFANEFENTGLTARLIGTKRGTNERQIAFEDVFDKVIISSPVDEVNKVRSTLLQAGPEGRQAWTDLKAAGIRYVRDRATTGTTGADEFGRPLLSPAALTKTIRSLDQEGKLQSLYGKRQAQTLRDLADLSVDIYTAPPGSVNFSNTASALQLALDGIATYGMTGVPAPAVTALREASKFVKNRKTRARIEAALRGQVTSND